MKAKFISRVLQIMNELGWDDTGSNAFIGSDKTKITEHIESVFVDAWRKAVKVLPKYYFKTVDFSQNTLTGDIANGTGSIELPDDFYLLRLFKMKGWHKAVEVLYDSSDSIASIQSNEYTRGNIVRPVCVKNTNGVKSVLEYYSLPKGFPHEVEAALYIPLIDPLSEDTVLDEKLFIPLAYLCASQVFYIYEKPDIAKVLEGLAVEISN